MTKKIHVINKEKDLRRQISVRNTTSMSGLIDARGKNVTSSELSSTLALLDVALHPSRF